MMNALQDFSYWICIQKPLRIQFWEFHIFHAFHELRCTYRSRKVLHDYLFGW